MKRFVAYFRVSTDRQGKSGLGLDAQRRAVEAFLHEEHGELVGEFTEVETGKGRHALDRRPELKAALEACGKKKATLVIAKLDRLARNVAFISSLMESKVDFVAADMPQANRLTVHILAAVAEHEREMISTRTIEALASARARGVKLGSPKSEKGRIESEKVRKEQADQFAANVYPVIANIRSNGASSLRAIADSLNSRGIRSPRGGDWHPASVARLIERQEKAQ